MGKGKKKGGNAGDQPPKKCSLEEQKDLEKNSQATQTNNQTGKGQDKNNENYWECNCGYVNFAKKKMCKKCGKPRVQEKIAEPSTSTNLENVPQQQQISRSSTIQQISTISTEQQILGCSIQRPESRQLIPSLQKSIRNVEKLQISRGTNIIESSPDGRVYEGTKGRKCIVEVNYATIEFVNLAENCYHYDVTFIPEIPKKMLTAALDEFMRTQFNGHVYCFDARKNMYTAEKLNIENDVHCAKVTANFQDRSREFEITVKHVATVDMHVLLNNKNPMFQKEDKPSQAIQALDVILKSPFKSNIDNGTAIQAGRAVFFVPKNLIYLGDGMELWYGLFQSAILGRAKLYLNIDVIHKAFPSCVSLLEHLNTFDKDFKLNPDASLNDQQRKKLKAHLAMLTIGYRTNDSEPIKRFSFVDLYQEDCSATFVHNNKKITIYNYFENIKGIKLKYTKLPLIWVGSRQRKTLLPMEFCMIPAGQATNKKCTTKCVQELIIKSATTTDIRKKKIRELLNEVSYESDPTLEGFGIKINKNFEKVEARIIEPPKLMYSNRLVDVDKGKWSGGDFLTTVTSEHKKRIKWGILNFDYKTKISDLSDFKIKVIKEAKRKNIDLEDFKASEIKTFDCRNGMNALYRIANDMKQAGCKLVFSIVSEFNNSYSMIKQITESNSSGIGMLTQCIQGKNIKSKLINSIISNILLKLNAKLNGRNYEIVEPSFKSVNPSNSGVMFIGADVTHPTPDQKNTPSVVGVVSSYDQSGFQYYPSWRLQRKEMILDLENIIVEHLQFYYKKNNRYPGKLLYYRDGVSDGEFKQVLDIEMNAIRKALQRIFGLNPQPPVTFIVVQKRHHTRFFPTEREFSDQPNNNVLPGTVVDTDIVHPFQYQFFMVSHAAMKGVAKPTKYCILVNECKIGPDELQSITNDLCHFYTRCCRAVSYPSPTYYAHLMAARGKVYIANQKIELSKLDQAYKFLQNDEAFVENHPMFFV